MQPKKFLNKRFLSLLPTILLILSTLTMVCANPPASQAETIPTSGRYISEIFSDSNIQIARDIIYGSAPALLANPTDPDITTFQQDQMLDLYQPDPSQDSVALRPAIVWIHGGGFYTGDKNTIVGDSVGGSISVPVFAKEFAKRGYVCISINYRLRTEQQIDAVRNQIPPTYAFIWDAMHDAKAAVRWLRRNAATYHIDPNRIAIGGESAGATTSLYAAYFTDLADEGTSGNPGFASNVNAVIDLWGNMANPHLNQISSGKAPLLIIHGTADNKINYSLAEALWNQSISQQVPTEFYPQAGEGHGCPSVSTATKVGLMAPFLYHYIIMPPITTASPIEGIYSAAQTVTLTANEPATIYYTNDGSTPTTLSTVYSGPITIAATTTLKFFARDLAGNTSTVQTSNYTINSIVTLGNNVTVTVSPSVSMTFSQLNTSGPISATPSTSTPPTGYTAVNGTAYDIVSNATYSGQISVAMRYDPANLHNPANESRLRLYHYNGTGWVDVTTTVDTFNHIVNGITSSLSPFMIVEPEDVPQVVAAAKVPVMNGLWMVPSVLAGLFLLYRRRAR